jgi:hypothetical protein
MSRSSSSRGTRRPSEYATLQPPLALKPHPHHAPVAIRGVTAQVLGLDAAWLRLRWRVDGAHALVLPPAASADRADGLWTTTCFEAFLRPDAQLAVGGNAYVELNLSPSGRWNAYDFTAYRDGMAPRASTRRPEVSMHDAGGNDDADARCDRVLVFEAAVAREALPPLPCSVALCAVLEERGGIKSYWALEHPPHVAPDFHAATCFTARLESDRTTNPHDPP